jgi:thiamine-monophosphate kinase
VTAKPRPTEFEIIARYFAPLAAGAPGAASLADDVALLSVTAGEELVLKTDAIVAGVHFTGQEPARLIARKLLRVNLSDLAAKGARPLGYLLTAILPRDVEEVWIADFAAGLAEDQWQYGLSLLGGDTTGTPGPLTLSVTIVGAATRGRTPRRGDGKRGDSILVSGTIGDGALGLRAARGEIKELPAQSLRFLQDRYQLPEPRLALGRALIESGIVHASMDISDGLIADLGHICQQSGLAAEIQWGQVPLSAAARMALQLEPELRARVLGGGDDYELLLTVAGHDAAQAIAIGANVGVPITVIGTLVNGAGVAVRAEDGSAIAVAQKGFQHF